MLNKSDKESGHKSIQNNYNPCALTDVFKRMVQSPTMSVVAPYSLYNQLKSKILIVIVPLTRLVVERM